jgi:hypothetical protein
MMLRRGKCYLSYFQPSGSYFSRSTKPLPQDLIQRVEEELFGGDLDLTEDEGEENNL